MKLTIKKEVTQEVEFELPIFFVRNEHSFYAILSEEVSYCVIVLNDGYTNIRRCKAKDHRSDLTDINKKTITEAEFLEVYNDALKLVCEYDKNLVASNSNSI